MQTWTSEEIEKLKSLKDLPTREQSKIMGKTPRQIHGARIRYGIAPPRDNRIIWTKELIEKAESIKNLSIGEQCSILGLTRKQLHALRGKYELSHKRIGKTIKWNKELYERVREVRDLPIDEQCRLLGLRETQIWSARMKLGITSYQWKQDWSSQELALLEKMWWDQSVEDIAKALNILPATVEHKAKQMGFKRDKRLARTKMKSCRKYNLNIDFFEKVAPLQAYWAGFVFGDGYISKNGCVISIGLNEKDRSHLEALKTSIQYEGPIYKRDQYDTRLKSKRSRGVCLHLNSPKLVSDLLQNFGIGYNKSQRGKPINWFEKTEDQVRAMDLMISQCFGLINADGCLYVSKKKQLSVSICGNFKTCLWFKNFVETVLKKSIKTEARPSSNIFYFSIYSSNAVQFYNFMMQNCPEDVLSILLKRKWFNPRVLEVVEKWNLKNGINSSPSQPIPSTTPQMQMDADQFTEQIIFAF